MQRYLGKADAFFSQCIHKLRCEMQACRGRSSASKLFRIYSLILGLVVQLLLDIGRQRHFPEGVQFFIQRRSIVKKFRMLVAVLHCITDDRRQCAVAEDDTRTRMQAFAGFGQAFPYVAFHLPQQKQFADRAGAFLVPNETRRQHLGIVDDQQVPGLQKAGKVTEYSMTELAAGAAEAQQARGISWFTWLLGDQFFGQVKIKSLFASFRPSFRDITLCGIY